MPGALRLYLDFASPYSYFALRPLARLAEEHSRTLELRPILLWAVFKQQGVVNPLEKPTRRRYFLEDVVRSAEFFGLPFRIPEPLQISAHLAGRLYHGWTATRPQDGLRLASEIFEAFFARGEDIADPNVLAVLPCLANEAPETIRAMIEGSEGRQRLGAAVDEAYAANITGVPFVTLDGESFFGADRLPQIAWRLQHPRAA
ncbi:2-hydroxychromene-2-carboxylate isomerase [Bosea sp. (in: a-proteobacteria)]|jgi:2-hydroxychromene-2-carboxylate isomerase|uniref:2-hydroxychromene-2-carboxylate isomerase n=1 Tax=Bosea sp. (in: a-proteobacteria) TaxID=1871050 RepID=UPI002DDD24B8|nr:DsbA family protein [Bosea sp. (in: a-proteobacteria)]HEV2512942.1 DsbA family protein [Bosea sp. (in: a-proteobacteria)]